MSRPTARPLEIVRRLAQQIRDHANDHPDLWWETPGAVLEAPAASMDSLPLPLIVFKIHGGEIGEGGAIELEQEFLNLSLFLITADSEDPQRAVQELLADVRRAVMGNRTIADADGVPFLACGQVYNGPYTQDTEFAEGTAGRGLIEWTPRVEYQWTPETA